MRKTSCSTLVASPTRNEMIKKKDWSLKCRHRRHSVARHSCHGKIGWRVVFVFAFRQISTASAYQQQLIVNWIPNALDRNDSVVCVRLFFFASFFTEPRKHLHFAFYKWSVYMRVSWTSGGITSFTWKTFHCSFETIENMNWSEARKMRAKSIAVGHLWANVNFIFVDQFFRYLFSYIYR